MFQAMCHWPRSQNKIDCGCKVTTTRMSRYCRSHSFFSQKPWLLSQMKSATTPRIPASSAIARFWPIASRNWNVTCAPPYFICSRWARTEFSNGSSATPIPNRTMAASSFVRIVLNFSSREDQMGSQHDNQRPRQTIDNHRADVRPGHEVAQVDFVRNAEQSEVGYNGHHGHE